jgi:hypothetical protein
VVKRRAISSPGAPTVLLTKSSLDVITGASGACVMVVPFVCDVELDGGAIHLKPLAGSFFFSCVI